MTAILSWRCPKPTRELSAPIRSPTARTTINAIRSIVRCSIFIAAATISVCARAAGEYSGLEAHGRIIDAEDQSPVTGAVVITTWELSDVRYNEAAPAGIIHQEEALSRADGSFDFPAWGPVSLGSVPVPLTSLFSLRRWRPRALDFAQPQIVIFKPGYAVARPPSPDRGMDQLQGIDWLGPRIRRPWFNGQTFVLKRNELSAREYAATLDAQLPGLLGCGWTALPLMTRDYLIEMGRLERVVPGLTPLLSEAMIQAANCPNVPPGLANEK